MLMDMKILVIRNKGKLVNSKKREIESYKIYVICYFEIIPCRLVKQVKIYEFD